MNNKIYKCVICDKELSKKDVYRLSKQRENGTSKYQAFVVEKNYDFCLKCYKRVVNCIKKLKIKIINEMSDENEK